MPPSSYASDSEASEDCSDGTAFRRRHPCGARHPRAADRAVRCVRPDRALAIAGWGRYYLSRRGALSLRHRELAIDRTTALCGAGYEWGIHIAVYAGKAGLTDEQVASLATGDPADACWTDPADRAVLATVDALHQRADLNDAEWQTLLDAVGEDAAVDLLLLCGWYHAISFAVNALRLPAEPGTPALPGRSR